MTPLNEIILRLVLAVILGGFLGWEREKKAKAAGFRTHILICLGAVLSSLLAEYLFYYYGQTPNFTRVDISRIASGVVQGIAILAVAAVFRLGLTITGLSTAASVWITAVIGLTIGAGFYSAGIIASILAFIVLTIFKKLEAKFIWESRQEKKKLYLKIKKDSPAYDLLKNLEKEFSGQFFKKVKEIVINQEKFYEIQLELPAQIGENIIFRIKSLSGVEDCHWIEK